MEYVPWRRGSPRCRAASRRCAQRETLEAVEICGAMGKVMMSLPAKLAAVQLLLQRRVGEVDDEQACPDRQRLQAARPTARRCRRASLFRSDTNSRPSGDSARPYGAHRKCHDAEVTQEVDRSSRGSVT